MLHDHYKHSSNVRNIILLPNGRYEASKLSGERFLHCANSTWNIIYIRISDIITPLQATTKHNYRHHLNPCSLGINTPFIFHIFNPIVRAGMFLTSDCILYLNKYSSKSACFGAILFSTSFLFQHLAWKLMCWFLSGPVLWGFHYGYSCNVAVILSLFSTLRMYFTCDIIILGVTCISITVPDLTCPLHICNLKDTSLTCKIYEKENGNDAFRVDVTCFQHAIFARATRNRERTLGLMPFCGFNFHRAFISVPVINSMRGCQILEN